MAFEWITSKTSAVFTFTFPVPAMKQNVPVPLSFLSTAGLAWDTTSQIPLRPLKVRKRARPTFLSPDDPILPSTKKRRLRLYLITSPLSSPFSNPASHIADHGSSRIAVWAKARHLQGRSLRKAAILNRARQSRLGFGSSPNATSFEARVWKDGNQSSATLREGVGPVEDVQSEADLLGAITHEHIADGFSIPSPLGLSDYDALDDWRGYLTTHHDDPGGSIRVPQTHEVDEEDDVYSDFNFLDPVITSPIEDDDYDDPFSVLPLDWYDEPPRPPDRTWTPPEPVGSAA